MEEGFVYSWGYSANRKCHYGSSSKELPPNKFVIFSQNHDHVGNRKEGERLSSLISFEALKLIAGVLLLSPYIPLLFMGEEYADHTPFLYFTNHSDPGLAEAIWKGRKTEMGDDTPDPQDEETFLKSKISWEKRYHDKHRVMLDFYRELIHLRRRIPALANLTKEGLDISVGSNAIIMKRQWRQSQALIAMNFGKENSEISIGGNMAKKDVWKKLLDSSDREWLGEGPLSPEELYCQDEFIIKPLSFVLYERHR